MKKAKQAIYYPVFLNLRNKKCVVVGGGAVSLRKVRALLEAGAEVQVISAAIRHELKELAGAEKISVLQRRYHAGDLDGAFLAVAATAEKAANSRIARDAGKSGVLVNVVDDAGHSDFILPSYLRRGNLTIAISTAGASPALARKIRSRLQKEFGDEYTTLIDLVGKARREMKERRIRISAATWQKALDLDIILDLIKKGDKGKAMNLLLNDLRNGSK